MTKSLPVLNSMFGSFLFDCFFVNQLATQEKVNIFHGPSNILPLFKKAGIKNVVTIHDLSFLIFPEQYFWFFRLYYNFIIKRSLINADVVIADSYCTKKDIQRFYKISENKILVIYPGINSTYLNSNKHKHLIKVKYFFSISTHPKRKNINSVLYAINRESRLKEYKFVIAGLIPKSQLIELKKIISSLNLQKNVIILGYVSEDNLVSLYQNAEFFIYPSFYEGFGFPVLEAMVCGCPVITSDNSSLLEITPNKTWLINPYKPSEIANKMKKMLSLSKNERMDIIRKNYLFSQKFTWQKTAEKYKNVFLFLTSKNNYDK